MRTQAWRRIGWTAPVFFVAFLAGGCLGTDASAQKEEAADEEAAVEPAAKAPAAFRPVILSRSRFSGPARRVEQIKRSLPGVDSASVRAASVAAGPRMGDVGEAMSQLHRISFDGDSRRLSALECDSAPTFEAGPQGGGPIQGG